MRRLVVANFVPWEFDALHVREYVDHLGKINTVRLFPEGVQSGRNARVIERSAVIDFDSSSSVDLVRTPEIGHLGVSRKHSVVSLWTPVTLHLSTVSDPYIVFLNGRGCVSKHGVLSDRLERVLGKIGVSTTLGRNWESYQRGKATSLDAVLLEAEGLDQALKISELIDGRPLHERDESSTPGGIHSCTLIARRFLS